MPLRVNVRRGKIKTENTAGQEVPIASGDYLYSQFDGWYVEPGASIFGFDFTDMPEAATEISLELTAGSSGSQLGEIELRALNPEGWFDTRQRFTFDGGDATVYRQGVFSERLAIVINNLNATEGLTIFGHIHIR